MVPDPEDVKQRICTALNWTGPIFIISGLTGEGTQDLVWALQDWLDAERQRENTEADKADGSYIAEDPRFDDTRGPTDPA